MPQRRRSYGFRMTRNFLRCEFGAQEHYVYLGTVFCSTLMVKSFFRYTFRCALETSSFGKEDRCTGTTPRSEPPRGCESPPTMRKPYTCLRATRTPRHS